jgi:hypothetical protein
MQDSEAVPIADPRVGGPAKSVRDCQLGYAMLLTPNPNNGNTHQGGGGGKFGLNQASLSAQSLSIAPCPADDKGGPGPAEMEPSRAWVGHLRVAVNSNELIPAGSALLQPAIVAFLQSSVQ